MGYPIKLFVYHASAEIAYPDQIPPPTPEQIPQTRKITRIKRVYLHLLNLAN